MDHWLKRTSTISAQVCGYCGTHSWYISINEQPTDISILMYHEDVSKRGE